MSRGAIRAALLIAMSNVFLPVAIAAPGEKNAQCADTAEKKAKRSLFGGIFSNVAGTVLSQVGGTAGAIASYALPAASLLSDELLKLLDCREQQQAAKATDEAVRGGIGTEVAW